MRYKAGHKEESHARLVQAAGWKFRASGYGGVGVDGLAKEAAVTSGAFYGHFTSKAEVFREAMLGGLRELKTGILHFRAEQGADWVAAFAAFYLGPKRTCDIALSCALPNLSSEVERADDATRLAYQAELQEIVGAIAEGIPADSAAVSEEKAWAFLALLAGGVLMSRAVPGGAVSATIADHVVQEAIRLVKSKV